MPGHEAPRFHQEQSKLHLLLASKDFRPTSVANPPHRRPPAPHPGVDFRGLELHGAQDAANRVRDELRGGRLPVVLLAGHLHHVATLVAEKLQGGMRVPATSERACLLVAMPSGC